MDLTAAELIADPPHLHGVDSSGEPQSWGLDSKVLWAMEGILQPGWRTLETGAGVSTILFALNGTHHVCIAPDRSEVERIRDYCADHGVPTERLRFVVDVSERALPRLEMTDLDLVLIDGSHGFPSVFLDWFYTADRLRVGGWLVVDDTNIWTGRVLSEFLAEEDAWELSSEVPRRSAIFRKVAATNGAGDWCDQPYVLKRSSPAYLSKPRRAILMLRDRDFGGLWRTLRKRLLRQR